MSYEDCCYLVSIRTKPELNLVEKCSLTGKTCFCPDFPRLCTRRTFALRYETMLPKPQQGIPLPTIQD
jgi:hypothetical protein